MRTSGPRYIGAIPVLSRTWSATATDAQGTNSRVKNDAVTREAHGSPRSTWPQSYIPFGFKELEARGLDPICCGSSMIVAQDRHKTRGADLALPRLRDVRIDRPDREITLSQLLGTPLENSAPSPVGDIFVSIRRTTHKQF